jgi:hypothetical protein
MVKLRYSATIAPGIRDSPARKKGTPLSLCGLNRALPTCPEDSGTTRLLGAVRTRCVCNDVQIYNAQSQVCMRDVILIDTILTGF